VNYQTKTTKVQAIQSEQDAYFMNNKLGKGEWLVIEEGKILFYSDRDFREKFEMIPSIVNRKPTGMGVVDGLSVDKYNVRLL
jgi:hypothetical protein